MKNKDYVSQPKTGNRKKTNKPAPSSPFPYFRLVVVVGLLGVFGYGLYFLSSGSKTEPTSETKPVSQEKKPTPTKPLPPPPDDEEWQFIEELENKRVVVETEELENRGPYVLRCATVRSESRANSLKAQIALAGFESIVKPHQGTSGLWYRVDLGPFERKRDAEKARHALKRNDIQGCLIYLWTY